MSRRATILARFLHFYKIRGSEQGGEASMRYFVFASHGTFADGILNSLELITGKHDNVWTINAYINEKEDIKDQISAVVNRIAAEDELVVVTDIFGGSVNNEFMNLLNNKNIHLVAGLNLPLVIELVTMSVIEKDTKALIKKALENAKSSIQYCNLELEKLNEDDEF